MTYEQGYYERTAEEKRWNSFPGDRVVQRIVDSGKSAKILDVGSGTSEILSALPRDLAYTGLESSAWAIDQAKKKWTTRALVDFVLHDKNRFPFEDRTFDTVLLFYSLEHVKKPREILFECKRVLKEGGTLIIAAPNLEFPLAWPNALRHKPKLYRILFFFLRTKDYLLRIFGIYTFRVLEENFTSKTGTYGKKDDDLWHVVSSWEVIRYLENSGFAVETLWQEKELFGWRKLIRYMPAMRFYGVPLAAVFKLKQK